MKRFFWLPAAALLALAACERNSTGAEEEVATVQVMPDQRVLAVGETLQLTATVRDEGGEAPSRRAHGGAGVVSDNASVATVSARGRGNGRGAGDGQHPRRAGRTWPATVQVTVAAAPAACSTPAAASLAGGGRGGHPGRRAGGHGVPGRRRHRARSTWPFRSTPASSTAGSFAVRMAAQGVVGGAAAAPRVSPALSLERRARAGPARSTSGCAAARSASWRRTWTRRCAPARDGPPAAVLALNLGSAHGGAAGDGEHVAGVVRARPPTARGGWWPWASARWCWRT